MIHLPEEPLWPYLLEIARCPESAGTVLAGGLGLRVKRAHLLKSQAKTLFDNPPELRATSDIDLFLEISLWANASGQLELRSALERLRYKEKEREWKFTKHVDNIKMPVVVDLMAREPLENEGVATRAHRVGVDQDADIHGFKTPEAFSIEDTPLTIHLNDATLPVEVRVAHPYAYLNLKVAAAYDWIRELRHEIKPKFVKNADGSATDARVREKHVTDVYAIVGMITEEELGQAGLLAQQYKDHPKAQEIREAARELYGTKDAPGSAAVRAYSGGAWAAHFDENYDAFWNALSQALGVE